MKRDLSTADDPAYALEPLREGGGFTLYRGQERSSHIAVLGVAVSAEQPSPQSLRRLENEYALASELDAAWAARPLALTRHQGRMVLILEDPGGEPLDRLIERDMGRPIDTAHFLRIAIGLTAALSQVHGQGLIHKDIKPANALVDEAGRVWLTGFGVASRLPRERPSPAPPEIIAGTLAYMSPEQTGRMNRSVDARSDLYSLGVTLYQMLTGALPFAAADPLEWVHCHIARTPAPIDRLDTIPAPISAIVIKLLAKTPEERYQTAAGVGRDLQRCLAELAHGSPADFPLGQEDAPDQLLIPEQLYGREPEVATLVASFDRVAGSGGPELVLVSGSSGIGKSAVVNELHKALVPLRGLFAVGKFDQYKRDIPYSTMAQAFQSLILPLLSRTDAELDTWRDSLMEALGANGRLMIDLVPELKLIIGDQPPVSELPPQDARRRIRRVLQRFIGVFARAEHPLTLFLDDLQWLDTVTLDLIDELLTRSDLRYLMLIGAYRDNEVGDDHPLRRKLDEIKAAGGKVAEISLGPLSREHLEQLITDGLLCDSQRAAPLAQLVRDKTGGNPFFVMQFVASLAEEGMIAFDQQAARWSWDINRIRTKRYTDNVVDLIAGKLGRQPPETRQALQVLACLGNVAAFSALSIALGTPEERVHAALRPAIRDELVERGENSYRFTHDRVQEAAYSLLPEESRAAAHLKIGRLLAASTPAERREEAVFEIVNQLDRGADLITANDEREQLAELHLLAGRRAMGSSAHAAALNYSASGAGLLSDRAWERRRDLLFQLELLHAECQMLTGDPAAAETRLIMLSERALGIGEQAAVVSLRIRGYNLLDQQDGIMALGLEHLRFLGAELLPFPTEEQAQREYERVLSQLGDRTIEELIDLPMMTDPASLATLEVLISLWASMAFTDPNLYALTICRAVNLSLEHGNSDASCIGYTRLGDIARTWFDDDQAALRFGRLGYELVERRGLKRFQGMTYMIFGCRILPWSQHVVAARDVLRRGFLAGNESGDNVLAGYNAAHLNIAMLAAGDPLIEVERQIGHGLAFVKAIQTDWFPVDCMEAQLQMTRMLRGLTREFGSFDDAHYSELQVERRFAGNPQLGYAEWEYRVSKMQACVLAGHHAAAVRAPRLSEQLLSAARPMLSVADYHFYGALARAACCDSDPQQRQQHLDALSAHHSEIEISARHCPENFANRAALVGGEIARLEGRDADAMHLYEQAIRSARKNAFVQHEALAYEVAARFYSARGFETFSNAYLLKARDCYLNWGADGKVQQLDQLHPHLAPSAVGHSTIADDSESQLFDAASVIKASQALSGEIELPKLINQLMTITLQTAGADRGLLVLPFQRDFRIEAEARADGEGVNILFGPLEDTAVPETLIRYAMRTRESVVLDDAAKPHFFSEDPYLALRRPRSVLCLPLLRQGALIGLLYLENTLASHVFTPERARLLGLLASQAAISLENARLYADLELQVGLLQQLPVSAWTLEPDGTPDFVNAVWLEFSGQTLEFIRSHPEAWMTAVHPEDREMATKISRAGVHSGQDFAFETRSMRASDGTYRWHLQQAVVLRDAEGKVLKFVGTTTDVDDQKRAEETLRQAQSELAHVARVATLNAMTASIAHEVSQPLSGILTNATTGLRMLATDPPNVAGAVETTRRTIRDANRASAVLNRIRAMFSKKAPAMERVDLNDAAREVIALSAGELQRKRALLQTDFAEDLPPVSADRIQLQQVILNLLLNAADAMAGIDDRPRTILVQTGLYDDGGVRLDVRDSGIGVDPHAVEKLFEAFYTTKANGMGVGLSICRSIIESHDGRLWAEANHDEPGATFSFSVPPASGHSLLSIRAGDKASKARRG